MAVIQNAGHMTHATTTADRSMVSSAAKRTGSPGGDLAESVEARLIAAFPASPMMGTDADYDAKAVSKYKYLLLTNKVAASDQGAAAGYWGFSTPESEEAIGLASSADLSWAGAPNLEGKPGVDIDGNALASNHMPNLAVPPLNAPSTVVETVVITSPSEPPGVGNGLANPSSTSTAIQEHVVDSQEDGNTPTPGGPTQTTAAGSSTAAGG